jgi:hypothetical protein
MLTNGHVSRPGVLMMLISCREVLELRAEMRV